MNVKLLSALTRIAIIIIGVCGLVSCLFWVPMFMGEGTFQNVPWWTIEFSVQYVFHWFVSLPCFGILIIAWRITLNMKQGKLFLQKNARYVNHAAVILIIDIVIFLIGNIIFTAIGWNATMIVHIFVAVSGLVISIFMYILSKYLISAAVLQEESDFTI